MNTAHIPVDGAVIHNQFHTDCAFFTCRSEHSRKANSEVPVSIEPAAPCFREPESNNWTCVPFDEYNNI